MLSNRQNSLAQRSPSPTITEFLRFLSLPVFHGRRAAIAHVAVVIVAALDAAQTLRCRLIEGGHFLPPRCGNRITNDKEKPIICCIPVVNPNNKSHTTHGAPSHQLHFICVRTRALSIVAFASVTVVVGWDGANVFGLRSSTKEKNRSPNPPALKVLRG